jgi:hypothetical protein
MYIGPILNELKPLGVGTVLKVYFYLFIYFSALCSDLLEWQKLLEKKTIVLSFGTTFYHKVLFQAIEGLSSLATALNRNHSAMRDAQQQQHVRVKVNGASSSASDDDVLPSLVDYQVLVQCNLPLLSESSKRLFLRLVNESPNVHHFNWIPQLEILSHPNVVLFVSHGGINGVMESLYHGKPVLGMRRNCCCYCCSCCFCSCFRCSSCTSSSSCSAIFLVFSLSLTCRHPAHPRPRGEHCARDLFGRRPAARQVLLER